MRVLQVNSVCGIGSTGRIATDIHNILIEQGHESTIAFGRDLPQNCDNTIKIGSKADHYYHAAKTRIFDRHGFGSRRATIEFIKQVKELNPDIIHLHNLSGYYLNIEILFNYLKETDKPVVWTLHDCWSFTGHCSYFDSIGCDKWKSGCHHCPSKETYPKSMLFDNSKKNFKNKKDIFTGVKNLTIVTPSEWLAHLVKQSFLQEYPVEVINNGIDLSVFKPSMGSFRNRYNLQNKFIILGVADRWAKRKGLDYFHKIAMLLRDDEVIVLVGLPEKQRLELPEKIIGIPRTKNVEELAEIYSCVDIFVNPTLEEVMGLTNVEALACGTPVITFNSGGSPECVDGATGFVAEKGDTDKIVQLIGDLRTNKKSFDPSVCRERAKCKYDKNKQNAMYIDIYTNAQRALGKEKIMNTSITMDTSLSGLAAEEISGLMAAAERAAGRLGSGKEDFTGWVGLPGNYDAEEIGRIEKAAAGLQKRCTAFVVIGIGGSYLGARAAYELLSGSFAHLRKEGAPRLFFAGQNISAAYHKELLEVLKDEEVCLCVISKSGTTAEPSIAFALLKDFLVNKYGKEEASGRIVAITDASKGVLREEVEKEGYESFVVPDDIGGRYSVLTPVGLLPLAVAGFPALEFLSGAKAAMDDQSLLQQAKEYAICRNLLYKQGKKIEIFESYEPRFAYFAEWLKQLFGESEGKEGVGIFPASLSFSSDLHSMGQFLQEGTPCFFETILDEEKPASDLVVPESAGLPLAGKSMVAVNRAALEGVAAAHLGAGIPMLRFKIHEKITPQIVGQVVYFFEAACALSAYMMGVNPFDQPGVEGYKREMRERL